MALQPRKMKYAKWQKGHSKGIAMRGTELSFGSFGLKSLETKWITVQQIEAARLAVSRALKKKVKLWIRIFPHKPITSKGSESDMGGGKGKVIHYVFPVKPGRIIFELGEMEEETAKQVLKKAAAKLPIKTRFIKR